MFYFILLAEKLMYRFLLKQIFIASIYFYQQPPLTSTTEVPSENACILLRHVFLLPRNVNFKVISGDPVTFYKKIEPIPAYHIASVLLSTDYKLVFLNQFRVKDDRRYKRCRYYINKLLLLQTIFLHLGGYSATNSKTLALFLKYILYTCTLHSWIWHRDRVIKLAAFSPR